MSAPIFRIARRNVFKNWRHSVGSLLAMTVGFVALGLFEGFLTDFRQKIGETTQDRFMLGHLLVEHEGANRALREGDPRDAMMAEADQAFLDEYLAKRSDAVAAHGRFLYLGGYITTGRASTTFIGTAYDVTAGAKLRRGWKWDAFAGRPLYLAGSNAILLGRGLGRLLECQPTSDRPYLGPNGLPIAEERPMQCRRPRAQLMSRTDKGQINAVEADIAGLFDGGQAEMDRAWIHVPLPLAQQLMATKKVSYYVVELREKSRAAAFAREVHEAAAARGIALEAVPWEEHWVGDDWRMGMQILGVFRSLMALVVVVIAGMAVFTTMVKSVSERTREIGTLRSIGFTRRQVVTLFAVEAGLLTVIASILGLLVTLGLTYGLTSAGIMYNAGVMAEPIPLGIAYVPATYVSTAIYLAVLAGIAGFLPARKAARRSIPDALAFA